jgi:hypothetical protein
MFYAGGVVALRGPVGGAVEAVASALCAGFAVFIRVTIAHAHRITRPWMISHVLTTDWHAGTSRGGCTCHLGCFHRISSPAGEMLEPPS